MGEKNWREFTVGERKKKLWERETERGVGSEGVDRGTCAIPLSWRFVCCCCCHMGKCCCWIDPAWPLSPAPLSAKVSAQRASSLGTVKQLPLFSHGGTTTTTTTTATTLMNTISLFTVQTLTVCAQSCGTHITCLCLSSITCSTDLLLLPPWALLKQSDGIWMEWGCWRIL